MLRRLVLAVFAAVGLSSCGRQEAAGYELDYEQAILLDSEDLAEGGIGEEYESLLPHLRQYVDEPAPIEEVNDDYRYAVRYQGQEFVIYDQGISEEVAWARGTYVFFTIVNDQLTNSPYRFYALYGGNDLAGMFLTPTEADAARQSLPNKRDWPYLPTDEHPWYGQFH